MRRCGLHPSASRTGKAVQAGGLIGSLFDAREEFNQAMTMPERSKRTGFLQQSHRSNAGGFVGSNKKPRKMKSCGRNNNKLLRFDSGGQGFA